MHWLYLLCFSHTDSWEGWSTELQSFFSQKILNPLAQSAFWLLPKCGPSLEAWSHTRLYKDSWLQKPCSIYQSWRKWQCKTDIPDPLKLHGWESWMTLALLIPWCGTALSQMKHYTIAQNCTSWLTLYVTIALHSNHIKSKPSIMPLKLCQWKWIVLECVVIKSSNYTFSPTKIDLLQTTLIVCQ